MVVDRLQSDYCAEMLRALAEPIRLRIVDLLRNGSKNVSQIADDLGVEMVIASHHLAVLFNAGVVRRVKQGRFVVYGLKEGILAPKTSANSKDHLDLGCCRIEMP